MRVVTNHDWRSARYAVLKRDGHACVVCGEHRDGEKARAYEKRTRKSYLEVNHIVPVNGKRKGWDCQNHLDNLETLCHTCHLAVTRQQWQAGDIRPQMTHLFRVTLVMGTRLVQCVRCGAADTSVALSPRARVGQQVRIAGRTTERCSGPTRKRRKSLRRRRATR